jgi:ATP-binding cassette subfamily F protein uup
MVTHDRYFLDRVANDIVELDRGAVHRYQGNYSYFVEKKAEREQMEAVEVEKARNLLRKELEWMRRQPQARGTKQKARIDAFYDTQEKAKGRGPQQQVELSVKATRQGNKVLEAKHLMKRFGEKTVLNDFSHVFRKQERLGIVGPNGAGKTTLLNILTQRLQPDAGEVDGGRARVRAADDERRRGRPYRTAARPAEDGRAQCLGLRSPGAPDSRAARHSRLGAARGHALGRAAEARGPGPPAH